MQQSLICIIKRLKTIAPFSLRFLLLAGRVGTQSALRGLISRSQSAIFRAAHAVLGATAQARDIGILQALPFRVSLMASIVPDPRGSRLRDKRCSSSPPRRPAARLPVTGHTIPG